MNRVFRGSLVLGTMLIPGALAAAPSKFVQQDRNAGMKEVQKGQELAERLGLFWIDPEEGRPARAYDYIAVKGYSISRGETPLAQGSRIRARDVEERLLLEAQWVQGFIGSPAEARRAAYELGRSRMRKTPPKPGYDRVVVVLDAAKPGGSPQVLVVDQLRGVGKLDPKGVRKRLQRVADGRGEPDRKVLALGVATEDGYALLVDPPAGVSPGTLERKIQTDGVRASSGAGFLVKGKTPAKTKALSSTLAALLGEAPKDWLKKSSPAPKSESGSSKPAEKAGATQGKERKAEGLSGNLGL